MKKELREEIEAQGVNVIHFGSWDNSGTHHHKVGQVLGDLWYVYLNSEWYFVKDYFEVIKVEEDEEWVENFYDRAETKEVFEYEKAELYEVEEFLEGHPQELVDFFNSTIS